MTRNWIASLATGTDSLSQLQRNAFNLPATPDIEWVRWFDHHRLLEPVGYVPQTEYQEQFHRTPQAHVPAVALN